MQSCADSVANTHLLAGRVGCAPGEECPRCAQGQAGSRSLLSLAYQSCSGDTLLGLSPSPLKPFLQVGSGPHGVAAAPLCSRSRTMQFSANTQTTSPAAFTLISAPANTSPSPFSTRDCPQLLPDPSPASPGSSRLPKLALGTRRVTLTSPALAAHL